MLKQNQTLTQVIVWSIVAGIVGLVIGGVGGAIFGYIGTLLIFFLFWAFRKFSDQ